MVRELRRVACVEDDPDIRELVRIALGEIGGMDLDLYASGQEAIEKAPRFAPEIILLDVMMPAMTGPETLIALREMPDMAATPIVFMTAKVQTQEVASYHGMGVAAVIPKPFNPISLADEVGAIWSRFHGREP